MLLRDVGDEPKTTLDGTVVMADTTATPAGADLEAARVHAEVAAQLFGGAKQIVKVGRYKVLGRIGTGATGVVYQCEDEQLHRMVAVKLLDKSVSGTDEHRERLIREARAMAQLSHPNVGVVHEVGTHDDQMFIAMELLEGGTLREWVGGNDGGGRSLQEKIAMLMQAGQGLAAAHAQGLFHRDFKPDNVLIGADGRARIVDFGLVRKGDPKTHDIQITAKGAAVGTPAYMAPEQTQGVPADALSDQFGFAVTCFETLYGARPHVASTLPDLLVAIQTGTVTMPAGASPIAAVHPILMRAMATDPRARFPHMPALLEALAAATKPPASKKGLFIGLGLTALLAGGLVTSFLLMPELYGFDEQRSRADPEVLAKANDLLTNGDFDKCTDYAQKHTKYLEVVAIGASCAATNRDWDTLEGFCDIWRQKDRGTMPLELCHPLSLKYLRYQAKGKWKSCLKAMKKAPDKPAFLNYRVACAMGAQDWATYTKACRRLNRKFPKHYGAASCKRGLEAMGRSL